MELKEFIRGAVMEVLAGVQLAQEDSYKEYGKVLAAPSWLESGILEAQMLELTATVTAVEGTGGSAGLNLSVVRGGVKKDESLSKASTVKMQIPITYPVFEPEEN